MNDHFHQLILCVIGSNLPCTKLTTPLSGGPLQGVAKAAQVAVLEPGFESFLPAHPTKIACAQSGLHATDAPLTKPRICQ